MLLLCEHGDRGENSTVGEDDEKLTEMKNKKLQWGRKQCVQLYNCKQNLQTLYLQGIKQITTINTLSKYSVDQNKITYILLHLEALILYITHF